MPARTSQLPEGPYTLVLVVISITTGICILFGHFHNLHNSDSLLPVLLSLQCWTPFYWGQDRFGMLIPLLASPIHSPFHNLLFQDFLDICLGLMAPILLARYAVSHWSWPLVGSVAVTMFVAFAPEGSRFDVLVSQPYLIAIALALTGLIVLEEYGSTPWGKLLALGLVLLAHWMNVSTSILLGPIVVALAGARGRFKEILRPLTLLATGTAAGCFFMYLAPSQGATPRSLVPISEWTHSWHQVALNMWTALAERHHSVEMVAALAITGTAVWFAVPGLRKSGREMVRVAGALIAAGLVYWFFVGALTWVKMNLYDWRYEYPSLLAWVVAAAVLVVLPIVVRFKLSRRLIIMLAVIMMISSSVISYGRPSVGRVRADLDSCCGQLTSDIITSDSNVIVGDYWVTYKSAFHAEMTLYERGRRQHVYCMSYRGKPACHLWIKLPLERQWFAALMGDKEVAANSRDFNLPLVHIGTFNQLDLYRNASSP